MTSSEEALLTLSLLTPEKNAVSTAASEDDGIPVELATVGVASPVGFW